MHRPSKLSCDFCSKSQSSTFRGKLIQGDGAYICLDCADKAGQMAADMRNEVIQMELSQLSYTELRNGDLKDQPGMAKAIAEQLAKLANPFQTA